MRFRSSDSMKFSDIFAAGVLGLLVMSFGCNEAAAAVHRITDYGYLLSASPSPRDS